MDEEEKKSQQGSQENDDQQSSFNQTGQVADKAKKIGKQALRGLRGLGVAGKAAETTGEAAATAGAGGTTAGVTTGATAGEAGTAAGATGSAVGAAVTAGGSGIGAQALIVVVLIIFLMTILIAMMGSQQATTATSYGPTPTQPIQPPEYVPTCDEVDSYLVQLNVDAREITDCGRKQILFTTVSRVLSYPRMSDLMGEKAFIFISKDDGTTCGGSEAYWGCVKSGGKVWLKNFDDPNDNTPWPYVITHELFHVLGRRAPAISAVYKNAYTRFDQGRNCYKGTPGSSIFVIKTYDFDTNDPSESFAESGALYVFGRRKSIEDFKTQCPDNYNFWVQAIGESESVVGTGERCTAGTRNTCGDKYNISKNPDGLNFGDPNCELTSGGTINRQLIRDELKRQLQSYNKTKDYCRWSCIIFHESGYNSNSINNNAPRAHGAWGFFQMSPWACYGIDKGYKYNRTGNVEWKEQIKRALRLQYNALEPNDLDWRYWSTSRTCVFDKFGNGRDEPDWNGLPPPNDNCKNIGQ